MTYIIFQALLIFILVMLERREAYQEPTTQIRRGLCRQMVHEYRTRRQMVPEHRILPDNINCCSFIVFFIFFLNIMSVKSKFTPKAIRFSSVGMSNRIFAKVCSVDVSNFLFLHFLKILIFGKVTLKKRIVRHLTLHSPTPPKLEHGNEYAVTLICDLTKYLVTIPTPDKSAKL